MPKKPEEEGIGRRTRTDNSELQRLAEEREASDQRRKARAKEEVDRGDFVTGEDMWNRDQRRRNGRGGANSQYGTPRDIGEYTRESVRKSVREAQKRRGRLYKK